ncbi:MAG: tetraacyldisaccharide 4'-kinase [Planctomycetota bacterium]
MVLLPLAAVYQVATAARNALYDSGLLAPKSVGVPVISVGNLTVGGTGKTPLIIALAHRARERGRAVMIVSRGYGGVADESGRSDEVALLAQRCAPVQVLAGPDKLNSARQAVQQGAELILVDDGMQHRRLHRDVEIVMVDARAPFGNGMLIPVGPLRESAAGIARAQIVILTHGELLSSDERGAAEAAVRGHRLGIELYWGRHVPRGVRPVTGGPLQPAEALEGTGVHLFCGIGSPAGFRATVEALGAVVQGVTAFRDHHEFRAEDLAAVRAGAREALLLCTEKDALKVARIPGNEDIQCLVIDFELESDWPHLPGLDAPWSGARKASAAQAGEHHH